MRRSKHIKKEHLRKLVSKTRHQTKTRPKAHSLPSVWTCGVKEIAWSKTRMIPSMLKSTSNVQICPKKVISPIFWGWDWDHQSYSGEESGFLGVISNYSILFQHQKVWKIKHHWHPTFCMQRSCCIMVVRVRISTVEIRIIWGHAEQFMQCLMMFVIYSPFAWSRDQTWPLVCISPWNLLQYRIKVFSKIICRLLTKG